MNFGSDGGLKIEISLHPSQMEVFLDAHRFRVLVAGRRFGKTFLAVTEAICAALDEANVKKLPVYLIAPTHSQAKQLYWRPLLNQLGFVEQGGLIENSNSNEGLIYLTNGVMIGVKGADNPDSLRGPGLWFVVLDEFASMKAVVWDEIIRPALADARGRALFIGTPRGRNHFFKLYVKGMEGKDPEWAAFKYTSYENPYLPAGEIDAAKESMSSSAFRQEHMAAFEMGSGAIFKHEWFKFDENEPKQGEYLVAVDLAGFSDLKTPTNRQKRALDQTVIAIVKIDADENWWVKDLIVGRWGTEETARRIVDTLETVRPAAFGIEAGALYRAVMPYVMDEANKRRKPVAVNVTPLSHDNKTKTERITWALQGRIEHGRVKFRPASWNDEAVDEFTNFPSPLVHDDIPDALAYVAKLAESRAFQDLSELQDASYWEPQNASVGF